MLSFSVKCSLCQYLHIPHRDCSLSNKTITNGFIHSNHVVDS